MFLPMTGHMWSKNGRQLYGVNFVKRSTRNGLQAAVHFSQEEVNLPSFADFCDGQLRGSPACGGQESFTTFSFRAGQLCEIGCNLNYRQVCLDDGGHFS